MSTEVRVRRRLDTFRAEDFVLDKKTLVPGGILLVDSGDAVPADRIVLGALSLQISQSRFDHKYWQALVCFRANPHLALLVKANPNERYPLCRARKKKTLPLNWRISFLWEPASSLEVVLLLS